MRYFLKFSPLAFNASRRGQQAGVDDLRSTLGLPRRDQELTPKQQRQQELADISRDQGRDAAMDALRGDLGIPPAGQRELTPLQQRQQRLADAARDHGKDSPEAAREMLNLLGTKMAEVADSEAENK